MKDLYLAIDLGTTSCKVALFTDSGNVKAIARRELQILHPHPDWMEADPNNWWKQTKRLIRQVLAVGRVHPSRIIAVGITGFMHSLVPVAREGDAISRVMLWPDQRCVPSTRQLMEEFGEQWQAITGSGVTWWVGAAKLHWLRRCHPELVGRAEKLLLPKDFVRFKLTGLFGTDITDALGTHLVERRSGEWSRELVEDVLQVPMGKLPEILPSHEIVGKIHASAATETGLKEGTPVVCGAGDSHSTLVGSNMYEPRRLCLYLGTAAWIMRSLHEDSQKPDTRVPNWRPRADPDLRIRFIGATIAFGASVRWFRDSIAAFTSRRERQSYRWVDSLAAESPIGSDGVRFLPHLMGERGLRERPELRGSFHNLTLAHGQSHLLRAVLEGNALFLRMLMDGHNIEDIETTIAVGGGAHSVLWKEIIASVLNRTLHVPRVLEATALGAAILAAVGAGQFDSCKVAAGAWVREGDVQHPNKEWAVSYDKLYSQYKAQIADRVCKESNSL